jgi:hypothetical protein
MKTFVPKHIRILPLLLCLFVINSYSQTGTISIGSGVYYTLGGDNSVNNTDTINLSGGTLSSGLTIGYTDTLGTLKLSARSIIKLGTGTDGKLVFSNSKDINWEADPQYILKIQGWVGNYGNSGTQGKIFVGTNATDGLSAQQLAKISFEGKGVGAMLLPTGELVPALSGTPFIDLNEGPSSIWNDCIDATAVLDTFTVAAGNLVNKFYVNAPSGFEISLTQIGAYSSSIELTPDITSGIYTETNVYIRRQSTVSTGTITGNVSATYLGQTLNYFDVSATVRPLPSFSITGGILCAGGTLKLSAPNTYTTYSWSPGGSTDSTRTISAAGTYTVTVTDVYGCIATEDIDISVTPLPVVSITPDPSLTICDGRSVTLTASAGSTYAWTSSTGTPVGATLQAITATQAGIYTVTVTNANGCSASAGVTVVVNPKPTVSITPDGPLTFCVGDVKLTASLGTNYVWTSDNASGPISNTTRDITATESGIYTVTITTSEYGCSKTIGETVTVYTPANAGTIDGLDSVYVGFSATLTSNGDAGGTWKTSNAAVASVNSSTGEVTGVTAGTVTISYIVQSTHSECGPDTARFTFTVVPESGPQPIKFSPRSYIINMSGARYYKTATSIDITKPTYANSLKPYGLIHQLLRENRAPVYAVIRKGKLKDEFDFTHEDSSYGGGSYIIPAEYVSAQDSAVIRTWQNAGVLISRIKADTLTLDTTYNVYKMTYAPKWVKNDAANDNIVNPVFTNAGLSPQETYYPEKNISVLESCTDILLFPHLGSATQDQFLGMINWIKTYKGNIWGTCQTPSTFEDLVSTTGKKYNFLTRTPNPGVTNLKPALFPFRPQYFDDPIAQYIGKSDGAHTNGSTSAWDPLNDWNPNAKLITLNNENGYNTNQTSNVYGHAYDTLDYGYAFYQGGHMTGGTEQENVAAGRMFFNYSFYIVNERLRSFIPHKDLSTSPISSSIAGKNISLSIGNDTTAGVTYSWSASPAIGSFTKSIGSSTTYALGSTISVPTTIEFTINATDACGRSTFETKKLLINPLPSSLTVTGTPTLFEACEGAVSATQTVTVSGSSLDAKVVVTAPADFEITLNQATPYSATLTLTTTAGELTTTNIYIRLKAGLAPGSTTGDLSFVSGSSSRTVALSGFVGTAANAGTISSTALSVCVNENIELSSDGDLGGQWATSDDGIATIDPSGNLTGIAAGTVTITYTVTGSGTCTDEDVSHILISVIAPPNSGTITGTTEICIAATTNLTSDGDPSGTWSSEDLGIANVDANGLVTGVSAGTVTITFTVAATSPCFGDSTSIILIKVTAPPNAGTISGDAAVCVAATTTLSSEGDAG